MKKFIIFSFLALFAFQLYGWFSCRDFKPAYHFSVYNLKLASDNLIHNDIGVPFTLIRFYHNKITLTLIEIFTSYLLFWDVKFLVNLFLFNGVVGMFCGIWYGLRSIQQRIQQRLSLKLLLFLVLAFPLLEIIFKPNIYFPLKITIYSLPYQIFSLFGIAKLMESKRGDRTYIFLVAIAWLSVWWQVVLFHDLRNFCM